MTKNLVQDAISCYFSFTLQCMRRKATGLTLKEPVQTEPAIPHDTVCMALRIAHLKLVRSMADSEPPMRELYCSRSCGRRVSRLGDSRRRGFQPLRCKSNLAASNKSQVCELTGFNKYARLYS